MSTKFPASVSEPPATGWHARSLKSQLVITFSSAVVISLVVAELISIAFLLVVNNNITTTSTNILTSQLENTLADSVVSTAAQLFESEVQRIVDSALQVIAVGGGDALGRTDYSTGAETSYFDAPETLAAPLVTLPANSTRYMGQAVSLHSTWMIPAYTSATPPTNLPPATAANLAATAHLDALSRPAFASNPSILALYAATPDGFFRQFPGTGQIRSRSPDGTYDPRTRPWYKMALSYTAPTVTSPSAYVVTDPFLGLQGNGWLMTASTVFPSPTDPTQYLGVAGVAFTLLDLASKLATFTVGRNDSLVGIYNLASGKAIAHPQWDLSAGIGQTSLGAFTYANVTSPTITSTLWQQIVSQCSTALSTSTNAHASTTYTDPATGASYLVIWKTLAVLDGTSPSPPQGASWVAVGTIPLSLATQPVQSVQSQMSQILTRTALITLAVFILVTLIVLLLVSHVAKVACEPLERLTKASGKITNNIGMKDLTQGVDGGPSTGEPSVRTRRGFGAVDETEELGERFYELVRSIREEGAKEDASKVNGFYKSDKVPGWAEVGVDEGVKGMLPDAPPGYEESQGSHVPGSSKAKGS
ncbi:hypothetical protein HK101_009716 [Irineochytrium annulatum]|nr:hypothetical protein HK101_009716 [Irineochytrium annulatum]